MRFKLWKCIIAHPFAQFLILGREMFSAFAREQHKAIKPNPPPSQNFQNKDHKLHFLGAAYKKKHFKLLQILLAVLVANKVGTV